MFYILAQSNLKEESDRINLLTWLAERLPLAMIENAVVQGYSPHEVGFYVIFLSPYSGICVVQMHAIVFGVLFKEFQICKKIIRVGCPEKV